MSDGRQQTFASQFYPFLNPRGAGQLDTVLASVKASMLQKCSDVIALRQQVIAQQADDLVRCAEAMARAFAQGGKLLAFGNGGSATDAQDVVADCMLCGLPALALTSDVAVVTAVGNDVGFENIFVRSLIALGQQGDIAIGLSTSGNSRNVERAFEQAHRMGLLTMGFAGYEGGRTAALARSGIVDFCFVAPSSYVPRIQEAQATTYHTLIELARRMTDDGRRTTEDRRTMDDGRPTTADGD